MLAMDGWVGGAVGSERRFVVADPGGGPGVVGRRGLAAPATLVAALAARTAALRGRGGPRVVARGAAAAAVAAAPALTGGAADLGGGVLQAGPDLFDVELDDGALLALARLVLPLLEAALHDDAHALLE